MPHTRDMNKSLSYYIIKGLVKACVLTALVFVAMLSVETPDTLDKFTEADIPTQMMNEAECNLPAGEIPARALVSSGNGPVWVSFDEGWKMHETGSNHVYGFCR